MSDETMLVHEQYLVSRLCKELGVPRVIAQFALSYCDGDEARARELIEKRFQRPGRCGKSWAYRSHIDTSFEPGLIGTEPIINN